MFNRKYSFSEFSLVQLLSIQSLSNTAIMVFNCINCTVIIIVSSRASKGTSYDTYLPFYTTSFFPMKHAQACCLGLPHLFPKNAFPKFSRIFFHARIKPRFFLNILQITKISKIKNARENNLGNAFFGKKCGNRCLGFEVRYCVMQMNSMDLLGNFTYLHHSGYITVPCSRLPNR